MIQVLCLCSYPLEAAATRYRLIQYIEPLSQKGIKLTVLPFLDREDFSSLYKSGQILRKARRVMTLTGKRLFEFISKRDFDVILIQREAMIFGPPIFEWLYQKVGKCPLILDLDDATYVSYVSPTYGRLGSALKFFGKTDKLIDWSEAVICGNENIAEYVKARETNAVIVPTVVDTDEFCPNENNKGKKPIVGWIGTHSTFPLLAEIFPVIQDLSKKYDFTLKIIGAGKDKIELSGVQIENLDWNLKREVQDFQSLNIGLYPLETTKSISKDLLAGKSGFKAIQYMAVGIPFVVTPIGICATIGIENETHFSAISKENWYECLSKLLESEELRHKMGRNGRQYALKHYTVSQQTEKIADLIKRVAAGYKN